MKLDLIQQGSLNYLKECFDVEDIFMFCQQHRVEVLVQSDCQYHCFIDYKEGDGCYAADIDPLGAMVTAIKNFKERPIKK